MEGTRHTMNNKNDSTSGGNTWNIKEMYMVLSKRHNGLVVGGIQRRLLDVNPR
jgi:hypothetical protein